mmetsp:Transcript_55857/g.120790  ORF Transcript_55857/g.120790 Transcript_55857/m.120790 type:complete len:264 (-) Transcript_55857:126-917(-)
MSDLPLPEQSLELMRITVVGASGSGKTSLISAFVNNCCPSVHAATTDTTFYYKTVSLGEQNNQSRMPLLVEIEDSPASELLKGSDAVNAFLSIEDIEATEGSSMPPLLSQWEVHRNGEVFPVAPRRMGFLIVFDANDQASWDEAEEIHSELGRIQEALGQKQPIVYFVASKIDKDPSSTQYKHTLQTAQSYCEKRRARCELISAFHYRNVRKLFRTMLLEVQSNPSLFLPEGREVISPNPVSDKRRAVSTSAAGAPEQTCSLQ